jgi:hypothetical protein
LTGEQATISISGQKTLGRHSVDGWHNNTTQTTYGGAAYLRCAHVDGDLNGTYVSKIYDRGSSARYMVYILAAVVVSGGGTTWGDIAPAPMTWSAVNVYRTWGEIFNMTASPQVKMRLKYGDTSPPSNIVEKLEILTAIVTGRYFQVEIEITDPSDEIAALVENFSLKFCQ